MISSNGYEYEDIKSLNKRVLVKCPRCEKITERFVFWTGTGTPRFYCDACYRQVQNVVGDIHGHTLDRY